MDEGGDVINTFSQKVFICFAAEDRYKIAEPIVYHLKNYGIDTWYDRHVLLMGDDRIAKNLDEGASQCGYAVIILSSDTRQSVCAMEEISILRQRYEKGDVTIFPILYEISPADIPSTLQWVQQLIYKEVSRNSGTLEICNHIAAELRKIYLGNFYSNITYLSVALTSQNYACIFLYLYFHNNTQCIHLDSRKGNRFQKALYSLLNFQKNI